MNYLLLENLRCVQDILGCVLSICQDDFTTITKTCNVFQRNNTNDGTYKVNTGEKDIDSYLEIQEWAGSPTLDYWSDPYCNMINGTDGTQYPPKLTQDSVLYIYTSEFCRWGLIAGVKIMYCRLITSCVALFICMKIFLIILLCVEVLELQIIFRLFFSFT